MNVIALSLYGDNPRYCLGAIENARIAGLFYPGWEVHLWFGLDVPEDTIEVLKKHDVKTHEDPSGISNGMFWRHLAHDLDGVERYVVRDVDSRFTARETNAVKEWVDSGCTLHVMRDHPYHCQPMMGGMFGWEKSSDDFRMSDMIEAWPSQTGYGSDQRFVRAAFWERTESRLIHDSCGTYDGLVNWPSDGPGFVGEYVSAHGEFTEEHRQLRMDHISKLKHVQ